MNKNTNKRKAIVFDRNFGNSLGQIRSFGEAGYDVILIWVGRSDFIPNTSKYVQEFKILDTIEKGIECIIDNYSNNEKTVISTGTDAIVEALDANYDRLINDFIFFNAGKQGRLAQEMKKLNLVKVAEKCGFNIPKSEIIKIGQNTTLKFPIITKAIDSNNPKWKLYVHICQNPTDLLKVYDKLKTKGLDKDGESILVQEYVEKVN